MKKEITLILLILFLVSPAFADRHSSYYEKQVFYIEECERDDGKISNDALPPMLPMS